MRSDLTGRRHAIEERLHRVQTLALSLNEKTAILAENWGLPIDQLDPDGSLRASLTALAAVAARKPEFDVIITLPDAPFALRVMNIEDAISAEVVVPRDGPYESALALTALGSGPPQPTAAELAPSPTLRQTAWASPITETSEPVQVASDLAAFLWQSVGDEPA